MVNFVTIGNEKYMVGLLIAIVWPPAYVHLRLMLALVRKGLPGRCCWRTVELSQR